MRNTPRRRCPISKLESLEGRWLLSTVSAAVERVLVVTPNPTLMAPLSTPSAPPTVSNVQFEPLTGRILVSFSGDTAGYNLASLTNPANYSLIPILTKQKLPSPDPSRPGAGIRLAPEFRVTGVQLGNAVANGQAQTLIVSIDNNQPIKFGTYRFTIHAAGITDLAGNSLDGAYSGVFPSGNGQRGSDFVADLTQTHSTILPAAPVTAPPSPAGPGETAPGYVFVPSTRQFRVRYLAARPAVFQLAGGNKIRLEALRFQYFPGTYRAPTPRPPRPVPVNSH